MKSKSATPASRVRKSPVGRRRKKVGFRPDEEALLQAAANAAGLTECAYMHAAILAAVGLASPPKPTKNSGRHAMAQELSRLAYQWKKLGNNVNQLAHQANAGMVPIRRVEVDYVLNQHQLLFSECKALMEKVTQ